MKASLKRWIPVLFFLILSVYSLQNVILERSQVSVLKQDTYSQDDFRSQHLTPELYEEITERANEEGNLGDLLTVTMLRGDFFPEHISTDREPFLKYKPDEYVLLKSCYEAIWNDLMCFPIPGCDISYEDSFGAPRSFGGDRTHEGTDLFGKVTIPGYYPVLSMTDGRVEQIGWLPLGGYRIGIRSPSGGYFYYAHFSEYDRAFRIGETIKAGDILGYMGDTGYGPEGTSGQFPVHLHLGIYIRTPEQEELSVNPYWILRAMEYKRC